MMIDRRERGKPLHSGVVLAHALDLARRPDAAFVGIQPDADEQSWIEGRPSGATAFGLNSGVVRTQVELAGYLPEEPGGVIGRDELLDIHGPQEVLLAIDEDQIAIGRGCGFGHKTILRLTRTFLLTNVLE
jgi:hypothetical protein